MKKIYVLTKAFIIDLQKNVIVFSVILNNVKLIFALQILYVIVSIKKIDLYVYKQ